MLINKISLKSRLLITVAIPCLTLIFIGLHNLNAMYQIESKADEMYHSSVAPMRAIAETASQIPRMRVGIDMMFLQQTELKDSKGVRTRVKETRSEDIPAMRKALKFAVEEQTDADLKIRVQQLSDFFESIVKHELDPMLEALYIDDLYTAQDIYRDKYAKSYSVMRKEASAILDTLLKQAEQQNQYSHLSYFSGRNTQIVIICLGLFISFMSSFIIVFNLRNRVTYLRENIAFAAEHLSLSTRINLQGKDELTDIADSFNQCMEKVHTSITQVAKTSRELAAMANNVSEQANHTRSNCTSQRDQTVQVATAIHQLGETVSEIACNASQAANEANNAIVQSTEGRKVVGQTRVQIGALSNELDKATSVIQSLASQVHDISQTLDTIRDISEQTNLLALNAAIEAARAGEQGRGFAVVADEVRTLAGRSAQSTEQIQYIIDKLQTESQKAVQAMEKGRTQSSLVVTYADNTSQSLEQISTHIDHISNQNTQVATATEEQTSVVVDINRNLQSINHLTSETTSISEQLNDSSTRLQRLSADLDKLVGSFKL